MPTGTTANMNKRQMIALQCGILATIVAILFPPWGYKRYSWKNTPSGIEAQRGVKYSEGTNGVDWHYIGYSFILSPPPEDPEFKKVNDFSLRTFPKKSLYLANAESKIAGHVLAAEIAVIVLLTAGAYIGLGYKKTGVAPPEPAS